MKKAIKCLVIFFLIRLVGFSQSETSFLCDTTNETFFKTIKLDVLKIKQESPKFFLNFYEGEQGYGSAYSFIYYKKSGNIKNKLFYVTAYTSTGEVNFEIATNTICSKLNIDSIITIAREISNVSIDTNTTISDDHVFYLDMVNGKKKCSIKFCESQLLMYLIKPKQEYIYNWINTIRRNKKNRQSY